MDPTRSLLLLEEELKIGKRLGYESVVFGCGELLLLDGWERAVKLAARLGFTERILLTNLTLINEENIDTLVEAGITGIAGTLAATSDEEALRITGRPDVYSRQMRGISALASFPQLGAGLHVMLTSEAKPDPSFRLKLLLEQIPTGSRHAIVSVIEPISQSTTEHPDFLAAHEVSWPELLEQADKQDKCLVVQNVPACLLGRYAHRSLAFRKRVARTLTGWPDGESLSRRVDENEVLYSRVPAEGHCRECSAISVCHRNFKYPRVGDPSGLDVERVVEALLLEEGVEGDPARIISGLRRIAAKVAPGEGGCDEGDGS